MKSGEDADMKVLISGASGLIGSALANSLKRSGHEVCKLVRGRTAAADEISWDPGAGKVDAGALEGFDAVVHLAGENVAQRWSDEVKERIRSSRLQSTRLLSETLSCLANPPKVFVTASAIGFYGDRGTETVNEESSVGKGFLAELCQSWEESSAVARKRGIRTVNLRIGVVLSKRGGALAKMLPPFLLGAGGTLGDGHQYMSWISMDDLLAAIKFAIENPEVEGPVNAVAPNPVTNVEFTRSLGRALKRPTIFPVPAFGARLLFGQMAEEMLLTGAKVKPAKLEAAGFKYSYPQIDAAIVHALQN